VRGRIAAFAIVASAALASASAPGTASARLYFACVAKSGQMAFVNPDRACKPDERRISWNEQGPRGPRGPAGPRGATGA
jgi:hypothetical protein